MRAYGRFLINFVFSILFLYISADALGDQNQTAIKSIQGLKGIYVFIDKIDPEIVLDGLTDVAVKKEVENRLRMAKIRVLSKDKWFDEEGSPYLYVNVNVLKLKATKEYIYSISMAVRQNVYPIRRPVAVIGAATWILDDIIGITPNLKKIRASIRDQTDEFIKVYLSMNPR